MCYSVAPSLLNEEIETTPLPCRESIWQSQTPHRWIEATNEAQSYDVRFSEALTYFQSPLQVQSKRLSSLGAFVVLNVIVHRMLRYAPDIWCAAASSNSYQISFTALEKWKTSWEDGYQDHTPLLASNAYALLQVAYIRLHTNFSSIRSSMITLDSNRIAQSMSRLPIRVDRSNSSLKTAMVAMLSLRTRVKLVMTLKSAGRLSLHGFHLHLVSIECCKLPRSLFCGNPPNSN